MPSSTSSSEPDAASDRPFFAGAVGWLLLFGGLSLALGQAAGLLYHPNPLAVSPAEVKQTDRLLLLFGNSRFEAGFDPAELESLLGVSCRMFSGGGWHALHYLQLSLLNAEQLRAGRDLVAIDASLVSLLQANPSRLGVIRPAAAIPVATLTGLPAEARFDVLFGALDPLYRYRASIQGRLTPPLESLVGKLPLPWGAPPHPPAFRLITDPQRNWVMKEIEGDKEAFRQENRKRLESSKEPVLVVPAQRAAIERSVERLRAAGVAVILVEIPFSRWFEDRLPAAPLAEHRAWLDGLAARTGARVLRDWPEALHEDSLFYDDQHYFSHATPAVDRAFAAAVRPWLSAPP